jgi:1-acyl-sn-glycerol-3-phosphate acyltransferase
MVWLIFPSKSKNRTTQKNIGKRQQQPKNCAANCVSVLMTSAGKSDSNTGSFKPARPSPFLLWLSQHLIKIDLQRQNTVHIQESDLDKLRNLPAGVGCILTPNHADEMDPRLCLELARRLKRRFIFMCNREAFDEMGGVAGVLLQAIGYFSVERGGHDLAAKKYSVATVAEGKDILVIFPEGEIFYLNESLQPFHSGAIDIGMQAIIERRHQLPDWTAYIVPISIKYSYKGPIETILEKRVQKMERPLRQDLSKHALSKRLNLLQAKLLAREEAAYNISPDTVRLAKMTVRIQHARQTILQQIEEKNGGTFNDQARTIDQAWQLSAQLREKMGHQLSADEEKELKAELAALKEVAQLVSWQPQYVASKPSDDRMAEMVLKLERELYRIKRPAQLAKRDVHMRVGEPIDLGQHLVEYQSNPHGLRHKMAVQLRDVIQALVDIDASQNPVAPASDLDGKS